MADDDLQNEGSFMDRIKESPRTVSALIIILIVAAAIYAFSGDDASQQPVAETGEAGDVTAVDVAGDAGDVIGDETAGEAEAALEGQVAAESTGTAGSAAEEMEAMEEPIAVPEAERTGEGFVEVAQAGDGITHLARRATTRWLSENQVSYSVSDEHRIFIEDYIKDRIGSQGLAIGETQTITFSLIQEAVAAAEQLNEGQLSNLSQYTYVLQ